ncbi:helix-turn-helix transcriptional regulator [Aureliella helgolandensis]|uniref:Response regulator n=1 Tax=Aureliella helgolandensis TaxID=2527968 RepID=A0A518G540_9BACT|nr:helix-turn-helix transcriptional regulator [Aureliella helgolandensis]QDV23659.1 response regulator [Aureliella helgolandensis]
MTAVDLEWVPELPLWEAELLDEGQRLLRNITECVRGSVDIQSEIEPNPLCVYIKSSEGQMLYTNSAYERVFGGKMMSAGRLSMAYLNGALQKVAHDSDMLILRGSNYAFADHVGENASGRSMHLQTIKHSLLGVGHPKLAILGITQVLKFFDEQPHSSVRNLEEYWTAFRLLPERDQQCAVMISLGMKSKAIAEKLNVSDKTVDNRRDAILRSLGLSNPMEMACLLCRFQDNGFGQFGL